MLTTITPYWNRPEMLRVWLAAIKGASVPGMKHLVLCVGERTPEWAFGEFSENVEFFSYDHVPGDLSIGHYHNLGAAMAQTPWIMKLDVDTLPNVQYFKSLLPFLEHAGEREWFNGGMLYANESTGHNLLHLRNMPLREDTYKLIMTKSGFYTTGGRGPAATNFICRREDYLRLGWCDERFRGWGWEDYQQIYMLERYQQNRNPLPGQVCARNVTQRCRDEISRRKARELFERNGYLCLIHRWHPQAKGTLYKNPTAAANNKVILLECIQRYESNGQ